VSKRALRRIARALEALNRTPDIVDPERATRAELVEAYQVNMDVWAILSGERD